MSTDSAQLANAGSSGPPRRRLWGWVMALLACLALANLAILFGLFVNHVSFPLNLDLMEGTILQHVERAAAGQPIYPAPSPEFVPLAYNPLFYLLCVPFTWLFGMSLGALRLASICGYIGCCVVVFRIVRLHTASSWWALIAAGLFAGAYSAMDLYMDTAHADAWLVFSVLLGSYAIDAHRSRFWNLLGVLLLISAFWFKQHGAIFLLGGLAFLTWRDGVRRALPFWLLATVLAAGLYVFAGPRLFGSHFHYFTWSVPRQWSEINLRTFKRYFGYSLLYYPLLAAAALSTTAWAVLSAPRRLDIWRVQLLASLASGLMGALDPGSSYNVFISMGTFFIIVGTLGLHELAERAAVRRYGLQYVALFASFALLAFNPLRIAVPSQAAASYADLVQMLRGLHGQVYAPWLGQLERDYTLYPAAHWVGLEDMLRGPGRETRNQPLTRRLLDPVLHPSGPAYVLTNQPLEGEGSIPVLGFLLEDYELQADLGQRFAALRCLPKRYDHGWPRYLYRYRGARPADPPS